MVGIIWILNPTQHNTAQLPKVDKTAQSVTIILQTKENTNEKFVDNQERNHSRDRCGSDSDRLQSSEEASSGSSTSSQTSSDSTGTTGRSC